VLVAVATAATDVILTSSLRKFCILTLSCV
jgi:hypothetical protein